MTKFLSVCHGLRREGVWAARGRKREGVGGQRESTGSLDTGRLAGWAPLAIMRTTDCRRERNRVVAVLTCILGATQQPSPTAMSSCPYTGKLGKDVGRT